MEHAPDDANVLIAMTGIASAENHKTVVVGKDTDLLVLLCYQANISANKLYFISGGNQRNAKTFKEWDIIRTKEVLGSMCRMLSFIHAVTGCDTTSRIFGICKAAALKKLKTSVGMQQQASVFLESKATKEEIITAGEKVIVSFYNSGL